MVNEEAQERLSWLARSSCLLLVLRVFTLLLRMSRMLLLPGRSQVLLVTPANADELVHCLQVRN